MAPLSTTTSAVLDPDGATFTMARGAWANTYPVAEMPKWIAFYRRQSELVPDQKCYTDDVLALENLQRGFAADPAI